MRFHPNRDSGWRGSLKVPVCLPCTSAEAMSTLFPIGFFPDCFEECPSFLRHKMSIVSPSVLRQYSIPFNKVSDTYEFAM